MVTLAVTNDFSPNTLAEANDVDQNFSDIVTWANTNVIQKDAGIAFTNIPSGPASDPSGDNQFTRKAYVDRMYQTGFVNVVYAANTFQTGTITYPIATIAPPVVMLTVYCTGNMDLIPNLTTVPTTTSVNFRMPQKDASPVTGTARLYYTIIGRY